MVNIASQPIIDPQTQVRELSERKRSSFYSGGEGRVRGEQERRNDYTMAEINFLFSKLVIDKYKEEMKPEYEKTFANDEKAINMKINAT